MVSMSLVVCFGNALLREPYGNSGEAEVFCSSLEIFIFNEQGIFTFHAVYASLLSTTLKSVILKKIIKYDFLVSSF